MRQVRSAALIILTVLTVAVIQGAGGSVSVLEAAVIPCQNGMAAGFPCMNVDLMAFVPLAAMAGGSGNDIWGWTDPVTGKEHAIMGNSNGTAFVDISVPDSPIVVGFLPAHIPIGAQGDDPPPQSDCKAPHPEHGCTGNPSVWRDVEVYADHAFIVSEAVNHGMQVFDLTQLRGLTEIKVFTETAHYRQFGSAHTITVNTRTGFAYANGSGTCNGGGPHMVDIRNPKNPSFAGCNGLDGYTHDSQCVVYHGPDAQHAGREICMNSNEDTLNIDDVTYKLLPVQLSRNSYPGVGYTHQGWLTADHRFFLLDDELDEQTFGHNTVTRIFDVSDLEAPALIGVYTAPTGAIDHQMFIHKGLAYQANYTEGLHVLDTREVPAGRLTEVAYFDIVPGSDLAEFAGSWANYPYFSSGVVVVSGIESGLFVLRPTLADLAISVEDSPDPVLVGGDVTYTLTITNNGPTHATGVTVSNVLPGSAALVSGSPSQGSCTGSGTVTCSLGTIPNDGVATVTIVATALTAGTLTNTASVAATETDIHLASNSATVETFASAGSPGRVPDGAAVPGAPLTIARNTNPQNLDLTWGPSCSPLVTDYAVYQGTIGSWYSHTSLVCSTGGATSTTITPGPGGRYYLVVPLGSGQEGSYGTDSAGAERPPAASRCAALQDTSGCR